MKRKQTTRSKRIVPYNIKDSDTKFNKTNKKYINMLLSVDEYNISPKKAVEIFCPEYKGYKIYYYAKKRHNEYYGTNKEYTRLYDAAVRNRN
jgi:hypothetical protein